MMRTGEESINPKEASRALLKTASFAACHFTVAFTVAYLLTGSIGISSALALIEPICNTVAYFFHEKLWDRFRARRIHTHHRESAIDRGPLSMGRVDI